MFFRDRLAAVPKKYDHIDFKPPESVAKEAEKGLEYRRRSGKGGLSSQEAGKSGIGSGVQRAVNLKNRNNIAPDTIQQMLNFFSRHEKNKSIAPENRKTPWEDAGYVAWLLWGGDAGLAWAKRVKSQMEKADQESEKKASLAPLSLRRDYGLVESWGPCLPETLETSRKLASRTGKGTSVGVFIPLPEDLAPLFPELPEDPTVPHVTLLVVGDVTGREEIFADSVRGFFKKERGPILARLAGLDYFNTQSGRIAYTRVHFSADMGALRDRLSSHLQDAGFVVESRFPLAYTPHVTLKYSDDPDFRWFGEVPRGSWSFSSVQIWGLPEVKEILLGSDPAVDLHSRRASQEQLFSKWFED